MRNFKRSGNFAKSRRPVKTSHFRYRYLSVEAEKYRYNKIEIETRDAVKIRRKRSKIISPAKSV